MFPGVVRLPGRAVRLASAVQAHRSGDGICTQGFHLLCQGSIVLSSFSIRRWSSPRCLFRTSSSDGFPHTASASALPSPASLWCMLTHLVIKGRIHHTGHIRHGSCSATASPLPDMSTSDRYSPHQSRRLHRQPQSPATGTAWFHNSVDTGHQLPSPSRMTYNPCAHLPVTGWQAG